jgi:hypothetical protein
VGHLNRFSSLAVFDLHRRSLLRGNLLVLLSFAAAVPMSHFPDSRRNPFLAIPMLLAFAGLGETLRCVHGRWSLYNGGVVLCVYMDLMALILIVFFLLSPYVL